MTVVFGTLKDVGGQLAQGTVTVASLVTRPAHGSASTVITKERHVLPLLNGAFESPDLDPGPVLIEAASGGAFESWEVLLPEDGRHDLATLTESQHVYEPPVVGAAQAAAQEAQEAAGRAVAAADGVDAAVAGVAADAVAAGDAAGRAEVAADAADASAAAAGVSAGDAAASAAAAAVDAAAVGDAREYVSGVHESWLPGGDMRADLELLSETTLDAVGQAMAARDAAAGHADRAEVAAASATAVQARPAMWLWDGSGQWEAPPGAVDTDTVLNTATGEIHSIVEVTA